MRKFGKRATAILLGAALALTQPGWNGSFLTPAITQAAETEDNNLFIDGDLGDDEGEKFWVSDGVTSYWKLEEGVWDVSDGIDYNKSASHETQSGLGISFKASGTVNLYQEIASLEAGDYTVSGYIKENEGGQETSLNVYNGEKTNVSGTAITVGDTFQQFSFSFTLDEDKTNHRVGFLITSEAKAWVCLDSLSLTKAVSSDEQLAAERTNLENLITDIEALKQEDYTTESWEVFNCCTGFCI